ncbi:MAG: alpha/beta fold hydrolase [Pseudomonadales bacterium]
MSHQPYPELRLPADVQSRLVAGVNGLTMHLLEAGAPRADRPSVLLLHGFPELAYSWRSMMPGLADAGFHVIAPDQRGYGRTTGWDGRYQADLAPFDMLNLVRDVMGLRQVLGLGTIAVVGHDFGAPVAAWCGLLRPDVFVRVALMSAPFAGAPSIPDGTEAGRSHRAALTADLARLPEPRRHYQDYYRTQAAADDLYRAPQGVHAFLRAYYHYKSADWPGNRPHPLQALSAEQLALMPTYYVMAQGKGMAETVAEHMPDAETIRTNRWLPDDALAVYSAEYERTGFQGGLNWYRAAAARSPLRELFSGRTLDQPTIFIAGDRDWGPYQLPGALDRMASARVCTDFRGAHFVPGAGHWVQQEQPEATLRLLLDFLS